MIKKQAAKRINKLKNQLREIDYAYYVLDKPIVSDAARDSLKDELEKLEKQFPDLITSDSPTQRIGGKALGKFAKVRHKISKYSLEDVFSWQEVLGFDARAKRFLNLPADKDIEYTCEFKIDGLNISCIYKKGIFSRAVTRGDGIIGEDVTHTVKTIQSVPLRLKQPINIEVGGEIYMPVKSFEKLKQYVKKTGGQIPANPRNVAAGTIRQLDPKIAAQRDLHAFFYSISDPSANSLRLATQYELLKFLQKLGFPVESHFIKIKNINDIKKFFNRIESVRNKLDFEIDGVVGKVNDLAYQEKLGRTAKTVRWAVAYKFAAEQATTSVEDIQIQVGRTGVLTPVAHLKPVKVAGSTVTRATLHNQDEIKRLGIKIGDTVIIQKAGDVIPDIIKVLPKLRTGKEKNFYFPSLCPICNSEIVRHKGEAAHRCTNPNCFAQSKKRLYHFVSRSAFNIDGLGPKIIDQLLAEGLIKDASDIFTLTAGDLKPLERFAEKSAENLIKAIDMAKKISASKFIYALGIRNVGEQTAIDLVNQFTTNNSQLTTNNFLKIFQSLRLEDLPKIKDIGEVVAKSIYDYFYNKKNIKFIERLFKNGVNFIADSRQPTTHSRLADKIFVLTGTFKSMSREQAKQKIRALGGDVSNSVSKNTDFVVAGENPGSKYDKAKKLGTKIIDERKFLEMIK